MNGERPWPLPPVYTESEPIKELVQRTLNEFIATKFTQDSLYRMQAALVNLFQNLHYRGIVMDNVNPALVQLRIGAMAGTIEPANVYTEALLKGCVRFADDPRNLNPVEPVKRYTRYDLAKA
jgi:hypothetical protein